MVDMGNLVYMPILMKQTNKASMTKFARMLEPGVGCRYEKVTDECFVVKIDFEKKESYNLFIEKFWGK